jgi:hypothetical protein
MTTSGAGSRPLGRLARASAACPTQVDASRLSPFLARSPCVGEALYRPLCRCLRWPVKIACVCYLINQLSRLGGQAKAYGQCVVRAAEGIRQDICQAEFAAFAACVRQALRA